MRYLFWRHVLALSGTEHKNLLTHLSLPFLRVLYPSLMYFQNLPNILDSSCIPTTLRVERPRIRPKTMVEEGLLGAVNGDNGVFRGVKGHGTALLDCKGCSYSMAHFLSVIEINYEVGDQG